MTKKKIYSYKESQNIAIKTEHLHGFYKTYCS